MRAKVELSFEETSEYQKYEAQIRQLWKEAFDLSANNADALDKIAADAHWEDLDTAVSAAEKVVTLKATPERQIRLAILLRQKLISAEEASDRVSGLQRVEQLLRTSMRGMKLAFLRSVGGTGSDA